MATSKIEWTEATWNPVTGCTKISAGCANCYAERMALRLKAMGQPNYKDGFSLAVHEHMLEHPLRWRKPRRIFVNSMSDLFHRDVSLEFIQRVFETMRLAHWHQFQILTKRAGRLLRINDDLPWPENVWMGVSVESKETQWRIDRLRSCSAAVKFLSIEPLIGPLNQLDLSNIDWVIVGGESGPGARPMRPAWVSNILHACKDAGVPFFLKQAGNVLAKSWKCSDSKGTIPNEWPKKYRIRQYPSTQAILF